MNDELLQGHRLLKEGKYEEARKIFETALLSDPENPSTLTAMGDILRHQKDFLAASEYYRQALDIDTTDLNALRGRGDALRGMHQFEAAIESWKLYLNLKNYRDVFVLTRVADCYKSLNNIEESQSHYQSVLAINATNRYALIGLADLYHKHGMEPQAIEYYEKALECGVKLINILTIVGNLHYRQGSYEKARGYYEKTLAQDPDNAYALFGLGNYYRWKSEYLRAIELWERIKEVNSSTVNMLSRLGDAYRNVGQYEAAERTFKRNISLGYNKYSIIGLIKVYCLQFQLKEACDYYDELLKQERGEDRKVFSEIGDLFIKRSKPELAREFLLHALDRQKGNSIVNRIIGDKLKQLG